MKEGLNMNLKCEFYVVFNPFLIEKERVWNNETN